MLLCVFIFVCTCFVLAVCTCFILTVRVCVTQIHELFVKEKKSGAAGQVSEKIRKEISDRFSKSALGRVPSGQKEAMNAVIGVLEQFA
jgi:hypothetical protein